MQPVQQASVINCHSCKHKSATYMQVCTFLTWSIVFQHIPGVLLITLTQRHSFRLDNINITTHTLRSDNIFELVTPIFHRKLRRAAPFRWEKRHVSQPTAFFPPKHRPDCDVRLLSSAARQWLLVGQSASACPVLLWMNHATLLTNIKKKIYQP